MELGCHDQTFHPRGQPFDAFVDGHRFKNNSGAGRGRKMGGMESMTQRPAWKTLLAFAIIYFVWGSTFLAIRVGVREVPPFLLAAMRFSVAGLVLCVWTAARGERWPRGREWASALLLGTLIFVLDYGLLFWSEQRVPSGIAAVMLAMIP